MNNIDLENRTAIITGGAGGIGSAIAKRMLQSGATVRLWDVDAAGLDKAVQTLGENGSVSGRAVDITSEAEVDKATRDAIADLGKVDVFVNNAGVAGVSKRLWECSLEEWRAVVELNLNAVFLCCRAVAPGMIEAGYGRIVNIASIAGKEGNPNASHYSATKAGVIGLTKSMGKELAETGVIVNAITPAVVRTDILKQVSQEHIDYMRSKIPMNRFGEVHEVAAMAAWLASEDCSFTTGGVFDISGGRATY